MRIVAAFLRDVIPTFTMIVCVLTSLAILAGFLTAEPTWAFVQFCSTILVILIVTSMRKETP